MTFWLKSPLSTRFWPFFEKNGIFGFLHYIAMKRFSIRDFSRRARSKIYCLAFLEPEEPLLSKNEARFFGKFFFE